jgi:hypothetical protein
MYFTLGGAYGFGGSYFVVEVQRWSLYLKLGKREVFLRRGWSAVN